MSECEVCQRFGRVEESEPWRGLQVTRINEVVAADFCGPLHWKHGRRRFGLVLVDLLLNWGFYMGFTQRYIPWSCNWTFAKSRSLRKSEENSHVSLRDARKASK